MSVLHIIMSLVPKTGDKSLKLSLFVCLNCLICKMGQYHLSSHMNIEWLK